ncbi:hypothetical protein ONJ87_26310, partial [Salmonella enterica subsp. enterica serovar Anatum]|nr:hypothetical protein [Salmonella enterica subsp. enterica serovar Anatum]
NQAYTVSATYTQSEVSAMATGLQQARQRIKALEDAIRTHGLIRSIVHINTRISARNAMHK